MLIHWLLSTLGFHWDGLEKLLENEPRKLIVDGEVRKDALEKSKISEEELEHVIREEGGVESVEDVKTAHLERDGSITVIKKD